MSRLNRAPVWKGVSGRLTENEDSPEIAEDADGLTVTLTYSGTYAQCAAERPARGSLIAAHDNIPVISSRVRQAPGGRGVLVVVGKRSLPDGGDGNPPQETEIEVEWVRYDMPLATHEDFKDTLTAAELNDVEAAISNPVTGQSPAFSGTQLKYYLKRLQGTESYMLFAPVIRRTTYHNARPTTTTAGKISAPPFAIAPFQFVKTADSARKQDRRWARNEEWTGSYWWDPDLYAP